MSEVSKWYIKNIVITGLLFSTIGLIGDVLRGHEIDIYYTMFFGIFMGVFMGIFLGKVHLYEIKSLGISDLDGSTLDTIQEINIKTDLSKSELIEKLKEDSTLRISSIDMKSEEIVISTSCNWKSFGEKIIVRPYSDGEGYNYHIVSRPKIAMTLLDYGSNLNNILKIKNALDINPKTNLS